jgi:ferredoxin-type protein NapH
MSTADFSLQLTSPTSRFDAWEKAGLALLGLGLLALFVAAFGAGNISPLGFLIGGFSAMALGSLIYFKRFLGRPAGVNNDGVWFSSITGQGAAAWVLGVVLTGGYVLLYWWPQTLAGLIQLADPVAGWIGYPDDVWSRRWVFYGMAYTFAIVVMGVRAFIKYRHSRYHTIRTASVVFFQLVLAFLIPYLLVAFNRPEFYFSYFWPLKYDYLWPDNVRYLMSQPGGVGVFMVFWGAVLSFIATPILTYFFGKRWYCSWVCGCGGLAETAGDPYRHLSDNSLRAWQVERWMIHSVLVLVVGITVLLWINSATGGGIFGGFSYTLAQWYGFGIGLVFSGVVGVGFYPLMGSRVWCRFGCPMAAILGLQQKWFSRFRITTNGGQCISCGNCSTYCEMGIDVKWYAQRGQNVIRASCVGCGMCATVCPRGVLKLENGPRDNRYNQPSLVRVEDVGVLTPDW